VATTPRAPAPASFALQCSTRLGTCRGPSWSFTTTTSIIRRARSKRIIILGAGLAGLMVGYELGEASHEVVILEARTRPGGRVTRCASRSRTGSSPKRVPAASPLARPAGEIRLALRSGTGALLTRERGRLHALEGAPLPDPAGFRVTPILPCWPGHHRTFSPRHRLSVFPPVDPNQGPS
jgi:glycine/D-amino acid oxidase-like deaminating enzyme